MASPSGSHGSGNLGSTSRTESHSQEHIDANSDIPPNVTPPAQANLATTSSTSSPPVSSPTEALSLLPDLPALPNLPAPLIPPYWRTHTRTVSSTSAFSFGKPAPIRLEDNTGPDGEDAGIRSPLWARVVAIDGHVIVSGNMGGVGIGDYVAWTCRVGTVDGGSVLLHKRYSEFEGLRAELASTFPRAGSSLPVLPPKSVFYRFRAAFLEKRRAGLEYFLSCVLLNPEFASSAVLKEFVFS